MEYKKTPNRRSGLFSTPSHMFLMIFALSMSKITYVGAPRQLSVFFGKAPGCIFLREIAQQARYRRVVIDNRWRQPYLPD